MGNPLGTLRQHQDPAPLPPPRGPCCPPGALPPHALPAPPPHGSPASAPRLPAPHGPPLPGPASPRPRLPSGPACWPHSRSQLAQRTTSRPSPELSTRNCSSRSTGGSPLGPFTTVWCLQRRCSQDHRPLPRLPTRPHPTFQSGTKNRVGVGVGVGGCPPSRLASAINISVTAHSDPVLGESWEVRGWDLG